MTWWFLTARRPDVAFSRRILGVDGLLPPLDKEYAFTLLMAAMTEKERRSAWGLPLLGTMS